jgi:multiple sugar transport system substrate-binding protein
MSSRASRRSGLSRRDVIKTAVGAAAAVGPFFHVAPARAAKTLKILQWSHFVPGYDKWFNNTYTKEWGAKNGTEVIVDNINLALIPSRAAARARVRLLGSGVQIGRTARLTSNCKSAWRPGPIGIV